MTVSIIGKFIGVHATLIAPIHFPNQFDQRLQHVLIAVSGPGAKDL